MERIPRIKSPREVVHSEPSTKAISVLKQIAGEIKVATETKIDFEIDDLQRDMLTPTDKEFIKKQLSDNGWTVKLTFSKTAGAGPMESGERSFLKVKLRPKKS